MQSPGRLALFQSFLKSDHQGVLEHAVGASSATIFQSHRLGCPKFVVFLKQQLPRIISVARFYPFVERGREREEREREKKDCY